MSEVFVEGFGVLVGKKSERLVVKKKGEVLFERPFFEVERVIVATEGATVSSSAVHECVKAGIPIEFISYSGTPYASLVSPNLGGTVKTRRAQLLAYEDRRGVLLGRAFAAGKLKSCANNLKYYAKYRKGADKAAYEYLYRRVDGMEDLARQVEGIEGGCVDEVRGALMNAEGRGAAMYWEGVRRISPDFPGREGRGATDLVNSLLNYSYGILYNRVLSAATRAGLDPFAGYVHTDSPGKPSLVLGPDRGVPRPRRRPGGARDARHRLQGRPGRRPVGREDPQARGRQGPRAARRPGQAPGPEAYVGERHPRPGAERGELRARWSSVQAVRGELVMGAVSPQHSACQLFGWV